MLSLSENIAKCLRGATFLTHTVDSQQAGDSNHKPGSIGCRYFLFDRVLEQ